jgi:hypothetical protein
MNMEIDDAWQLLTDFTQSESLRKHALAVEACMRACSRKFPTPVGEGDLNCVFQETARQPFGSVTGSVIG